MDMSKNLPFTYVIGLEIHVELNTRTKMFCRCLNAPFGAEPNEHTCPICFGLPGTLPVPNKEAVKKTILVGKALGSVTPELSKFDRKHYFYPDLPKGYQISQYDLPLCVGGQLELLDKEGAVEKTVRFERVHLEEDAGKLLHGAEAGYSLVDLNRAGVPLMEMVSKPDLTGPEEARRFLQELRLLVRALGVSEADMEKGQLRCDVNVSIKFEHEGQKVWTPVTEIKNVNSTKAVERGLQVEGQRLYDEWIAGGPVRTRTNKITAGWDEDTQKVTLQRAKEAANDYRYFPEPDIPPLAVFELAELDPRQMTLPELPNQARARYRGLGLSAAEAEVVLGDPVRAVRVDAVPSSSAKGVANWLINAPIALELDTTALIELVDLADSGEISFSAVKPKLSELVARQSSLKESLRELGLLQEHDEAVVQSAIAEVFAANPQVVQQYRDGDEKVAGFLVGQVMKRSVGRAQPAKVQVAVKHALVS
jgi:aspartyl-tRNA(Asn)/glutamyl-tRNA(Gln) amidotransferase subunit B